MTNALTGALGQYLNYSSNQDMLNTMRDIAAQRRMSSYIG
jgi:hypothetical protein